MASPSRSAATHLRQGPLLLARGRADLVPPDLVSWLESLLLAVLAEQARRLNPALEAAVQFLEWFALAGLHEHTGSFSDSARAQHRHQEYHQHDRDHYRDDSRRRDQPRRKT